MKTQIVRVSALQSAKVMAVLYFVISIPLVLFIAIPAILARQAGAGLFMLVLMPVMYLVLGFLFSLLGAWIYNVIAASIGGFEFVAAPAGNEEGGQA
jgi:hypothetical protein